MADIRNSPGVHFPPPFLYVAGFGLAWWLHRYMPLAILSPEQHVFRILGGWFLLLQGFIILATGAATLFLNRTAIYPNQPASRLIQSGPYRFSRNPMYVGSAMPA